MGETQELRACVLYHGGNFKYFQCRPRRGKIDMLLAFEIRRAKGHVGAEKVMR